MTRTTKGGNNDDDNEDEKDEQKIKNKASVSYFLISQIQFYILLPLIIEKLLVIIYKKNSSFFSFRYSSSSRLFARVDGLMTIALVMTVTCTNTRRSILLDGYGSVFIRDSINNTKQRKHKRQLSRVLLFISNFHSDRIQWHIDIAYSMSIIN